MRLRRLLGLFVVPLAVAPSRLPLPQFRLEDLVAYRSEMLLACGCSVNGLAARVLALARDGDLRWSVEIPSTIAHTHDACATSLVVASDGSIYTTGYHANATQTTLFVAKLSLAGAVTWVRRFGDEGKHHGLGVTVTLDGSRLYVVGTSNGILARDRTHGDDMVVLQLRASDGDTVWARLLDSDNHGDDQAFSVRVDAAGHVYLVGQTNGRFETTDSGAVGDALHDGDLVVLSLDTHGRRRWTRQLHTTDADGCSDDVIYDPQQSHRRCGLAMTASTVLVVGSTAGTAFLHPMQWPPDDQSTPCTSPRCLNTVLVQLHLENGAVGWTNQLVLDDLNVGQRILVEMDDTDTVTVVGTLRERDDGDQPHGLPAQFAAATGTHRRVWTTAPGIHVAAVGWTPGTFLVGATTFNASYLQVRSTRDVTMTLPFCTNHVSFAAAVTYVSSSNWTELNPIAIAIRRHTAPLCPASTTVRYTISSADVGQPFTPASPHKAFVPVTGDVRLDALNPTIFVQLAAKPPLDLQPASALTVTLHASDDGSTSVQDPATHMIVLLGTPTAEPTAVQVQGEALVVLCVVLCVFGGLVRRVCDGSSGLFSGVQYRHVEEAPGERHVPLNHHLQLLRGDAAAVGHHPSVHEGHGAVRPAMLASPGRSAKPKCKRARRSALLPQASSPRATND
ncbi:hypothetical protein SPRG_02006 [Saprolegnia parasitica CBS 223.65]|uniref:Calx-beta domain-containing protein n=1 Tax=Saprolegnia parasitica (strain CBS 223.65) TaxID=695850 RepID=A0A067CRA2_SAPPC|nr:hypothetical protein SPRG_02006 [Saprolegnia parasitica CBS 223.65]KDO33194.1 hypothetical protein SPRG_02006 [Saprolegnia parasitica CBS 223.65]|eukprot:XP_012195955.1 hypothetical protein SPRG_02006 [Saprolegnia parasitica CBS 223.65]